MIFDGYVPSCFPQRPWIQLCSILFSKPIGFRYVQVVGVELWNFSFAIRNNCAPKYAKFFFGHQCQCGITTSTRQHQTTNIGNIKPSPMHPVHLPKTWRRKSIAMILQKTRMHHVFFETQTTFFSPGFPAKWVCPNLGDTIFFFKIKFRCRTWWYTVEFTLTKTHFLLVLSREWRNWTTIKSYG